MSDEQDAHVVRLLDGGQSFRQVATLLGMSLGGVQRAARRGRAVAAPAPRAAAGDELLVASFTGRELAYLGYWDADGKPYRPPSLNALQEYRAGAVLAYRAAAKPVPRTRPSRTPMTKYERGLEIRRLRALGWTYEQIGRSLRPPIEKGTVQRIFTKMEDEQIPEYDDDDADDWDDDEPVVDEFQEPKQQRFGGPRRADWRRR